MYFLLIVCLLCIVCLPCVVSLLFTFYHLSYVYVSYRILTLYRDWSSQNFSINYFTTYVSLLILSVLSTSALDTLCFDTNADYATEHEERCKEVYTRSKFYKVRSKYCMAFTSEWGLYMNMNAMIDSYMMKCFIIYGNNWFSNTFILFIYSPHLFIHLLIHPSVHLLIQCNLTAATQLS